MKKLLASLFVFSLLVQTGWAQNSPVRERALGVSFILNDFKTAQRIRNGSIDQVIREDNWAKFSDMAPGLALTYFKGLHKNVDFAATLGASFVNYPLPNKPPFRRGCSFAGS